MAEPTKDLTVRSPDDLARLIPVRIREAVASGKKPPLYRLNRPDFDRVPIDTFLIETAMGTQGRVFERVMRVVKPNDPRAYRAAKLTPEKRLLYVCWADGHAVRRLADVSPMLCRHVILPCDPRHAMVATFKFACDHVHAGHGRAPFRPTILYQALGIEPPDWLDEMHEITLDKV